MCDTCEFRSLCPSWVPGGCVFYEPTRHQHAEADPEAPQRQHAVILIPEQPMFRHPPIVA